MKILQALRLEHPKHVRKLPARNLKREVERRKVLGLEQVACVREFRFHGSRRHDYYDAGPGEARFKHREGRGHYDVTELDGLPRWAGLNDLSKVNGAASKDFTAPIPRLYIGQLERGLLLRVAGHCASSPVKVFLGRTQNVYSLAYGPAFKMPGQPRESVLRGGSISSLTKHRCNAR
ncbi:hypothetical protein [Bradyrhizobium sp. MOS001]|uniref:hypothetical protein n=1 Tax=Bradyrhizobium sp. MOS001 TaxID=2133948 RepID=UPI00143084EE|nr:hypothetical protein [Bradyrhizobium sp. MOS001]